MNNINNLILGDMSAVRNKSISYLSENYFWPVSESEFIDFSRFMHDEYINIAKKSNNSELNDIATVEFSFVKQLLQIFHYNYVKKYAERNSLELITGKDSEGLVSPNWNDIKLYYSNLTFPHNKLLRIIRRMVRNIVFNRHVSFFKIVKGILFGSNSVSVGSNDQIKREFIRKNKVFCDHVDWPELLNKNTKIQSKHKIFKDLFLSEIINPYIEKLRKHDSLFVKDIDFEKIIEVWSTRAFEAYLIYTKFKSSVKPSELLLTEISKPIGKLITVSYQSKGCKVYCFHHGNDAVLTIQSQSFSSNDSQCRKFVTPTYGIASRYKKHYSNVHRIVTSYTEFLSINSRSMYDLYLYNREKNSIKDTENIETIMLIGYPFNSARYTGGRGLFFYQRIDLEYRLINFLRSKNKRIVYKAHPDRFDEIKGVFNDIVDEILIEPFEKVWWKADLLLFTYTSTTTFGYALTTNMPIVLLDSDSGIRDKNDIILLDKRVSRVIANIEHNTRINLNKCLLLEAIEKPANNASSDYVSDIYKPS